MERKDFESNTKSLKDLIKHIDNSGNSAWIAGQKLSEIKSNNIYKIQYENFDTYCKKEFNISQETANTYIKIFYSFKQNEVQDLFISHLKTIAELVEEPQKRNVITKTIANYSGDIDNKDIITVASFINSANSNDTQHLSNKVTELLVENEKDKKRKKSNQKKVIKFGKPLKSDFISEILLEKEPINEMGVVALFCLIFPYIKEYFEFKNNERIAFKSIKYIQSPFPDACILCKVKDKKQTETELYIEFEYESFEFIRHKHHKSTRKCDMIICWQDNAKRKPSEDVINMPPVFELKNFLETGMTELIY